MTLDPRRRAPELVPSATDVPGDAQRLWTVEDLCQFLSVSKRWVHERTRRSEIPCYRFGTMLRFEPQEIAVWAAKYHHSPGASSGSSGRAR